MGYNTSTFYSPELQRHAMVDDCEIYGAIMSPVYLGIGETPHKFTRKKLKIIVLAEPLPSERPCDTGEIYSFSAYPDFPDDLYNRIELESLTLRGMKLHLQARQSEPFQASYQSKFYI